MNRNIKITVILCLLFVAGVFFQTFNRFSQDETADMDPQQLREIGALVYAEPVTLSAFSLQDHSGRPYTPDSLRGKWSLLFFGFTSCPDICPLTMNELSRFYRSDAAAEWRADTEVVMVSVDPFRDTPEKVGAYVTGFHPDFRGVTGDYEDVAALARQLYIAHSEPPAPDSQAAAGNYLIDHSGSIMIINPRGQAHGFMEASIKADNILRAYQAIRAGY